MGWTAGSGVTFAFDGQQKSDDLFCKMKCKYFRFLYRFWYTHHTLPPGPNDDAPFMHKNIITVNMCWKLSVITYLNKSTALLPMIDDDCDDRVATLMAMMTFVHSSFEGIWLLPLDLLRIMMVNISWSWMIIRDSGLYCMKYILIMIAMNYSQWVQCSDYD